MPRADIVQAVELKVSSDFMVAIGTIKCSARAMLQSLTAKKKGSMVKALGHQCIIKTELVQDPF